MLLPSFHTSLIAILGLSDELPKTLLLRDSTDPVYPIVFAGYGHVWLLEIKGLVGSAVHEASGPM